MENFKLGMLVKFVGKGKKNDWIGRIVALKGEAEFPYDDVKINKGDALVEFGGEDSVEFIVRLSSLEIIKEEEKK